MRTIATCITIYKDPRTKEVFYNLKTSERILMFMISDTLKEKMRNDEIYVNNLKLDKAGRIRKITHNPDIVNCISINRNEKGKIISYTLMDEYRCLSIQTPAEVIGNLHINKYSITNLQIDSLGRLVKKKHKPSEIEKRIAAFQYQIEKELLSGNSVSIPKYEIEDEYFDTEEMKLYLPEYMIYPIRNILGLSLSRRNISILLQSIVPDALQEVENQGHLTKSKITFCKGIELENYTTY